MKKLLFTACLMASTVLVSFGEKFYAGEDEVLTCAGGVMAEYDDVITSSGGVFAEGPVFVEDGSNAIKNAALPGVLVMLAVGGSVFLGRKLRNKIKK